MPTRRPTELKIALIQAAQTISGVDLATAQTPAFQTSFVNAIALTLALESKAVTIVSVATYRRRELLHDEGQGRDLLGQGIYIVYTVQAPNKVVSSLKSTLYSAISSGTLTTALIANTGMQSVSASALPSMVDLSPTPDPTTSPTFFTAYPVINLTVIVAVVGAATGFFFLVAFAYYVCVVKKPKRRKQNVAKVAVEG
jgi:hypothetical protein